MEESNQAPKNQEVSDGILGFVLSLVGFIFPLIWIVSFVISNKENKQAIELGVRPAGLTKAALIISRIGLILIIIAVIVIIVSSILVGIPVLTPQENSTAFITN